MIRSNTSGDAQFQVLGGIHDLPRQVPRVERRCDEDVGIDDMFPKLAPAAFLVRRGDELVTLVGEPFRDPELVLGRAQETGLFLGGLAAVVEDEEDLHTFRGPARGSR